MTETAYPRERTALLFVDPYKDFLSEGGKVYPRIKPIADEVGLLGTLRRLNGAVRAAGIQVVVGPHRRWEPGDYESWDHPNPSQQSIMKRHSFARRVAPGFGAEARRPRCARALGTKRIRQHRSRHVAETEGHHACDRGRTARQYPHRVHRAVRHGSSAMTSRWFATPRPLSPTRRCTPPTS